MLGAQYDWDAAEETLILLVWIPVRASYAEARERQIRVGEGWWYEVPERVFELLVIDVARTEPFQVD